MSSRPSTRSNTPIRYALTSRLSTEGQVTISLQLFKGRDIAHSRSLAVVERHELVDVMYKCRMHLNRLGVQRVTAPDSASTRLPPAQTLQAIR